MSNQYSAAHINAIAEEGTKSEAIEWLQKHWNSLQDAKAEITRLRAELDTATKYAEAYFDESELLKKQIAKLRGEVASISVNYELTDRELKSKNAKLRAALEDMIEISTRNSEATLMLIAIRKCAQHALANEETK